MKAIGAHDGDHVLTCGASVRISQGRRLEVFFGPGRPTPSRRTVQRELDQLTGMATWLENWPADDVLHHGVEWPGIGYDAVILDYDQRAREVVDLLTLGALLSEIVELGLAENVGWTALGVDPNRLKTFGGERPFVPATFFWRWGVGDAQDGLPPVPLSWDADHVLVAADPDSGPFRMPRRPSLLFADDVARLCGIDERTDEEAFAALAECLPWTGTREMLGSPDLHLLFAHDRTGKKDSDGICVVIREQRAHLMQTSRDVLAVVPAAARGNAAFVETLRRCLLRESGAITDLGVGFARMAFEWTQTFALLHFHNPDFTGGDGEPDASAWPWVPVASDVMLLHMGVGDQGGLPVDEGSMAMVRAYCRALLWCDGFGQSREDHPFVAHDDPRGILIASESRTLLERKADGSVHDMEWSPAKAMYKNQASYETWISSLSDWGFWIPKPRSTAECSAEIEALLTPQDRDNALREREKYPNQYRSGEEWLGLMTSFVGRFLGNRLREISLQLSPLVGYALGDRISHAEHGPGTITELDRDGEVLLAHFDGVGARRVPYKTVKVLRRESAEERALRVSTSSAPAAAPQPCPLCNGRGWVLPKDASAFPTVCSCKK